MGIVLSRRGAIKDALALTTYYGADLGMVLAISPEAMRLATELLAEIERLTHVSKVRDLCIIAREAT